MGFRAGLACFDTVFVGVVHLRVRGLPSEKSGDHHSTTTTLLRNEGLLSEGRAIFSLGSRVPHRLPRALINSQERCEEKFQHGVFALLGARRVTNSALFSMLVLYNVRVRSVQVTRFVTIFAQRRTKDVITTSLRITYSA